ncbi:MAG: hypothetical protein D6730_02375 [Bacteroidetes bacterium]|nr:MAG: hypothetical protein D6730_02375 [Bacteroidota bacterium]
MKPSQLKFVALFALSLLLPRYSLAGLEPSPGNGARAISLGYAYTGVWGDFWNVFHNPAGIAGVEGIQVGAYAERRFGLKELTYGSAGLVLPFGETQAVGLSASSFGFDAYRENSLGLSYAISVVDVLSLGVKLNYASLNIADYGGTGTFFVDVGINTAISEQLSLGVYAYNVSRGRITGQSLDEELPTIFTAGLAYQPTEQLLVVADVQKDIDHPVSFRGGIEYAIIPALRARVGVSTEPLSLNGGLGLVLNDLHIDVAFSYHERLGYTPHVSVNYGF